MSDWIRLGDVPPGKDVLFYCGCTAGRIIGGEPEYARVQLIKLSPDCQIHKHADLFRDLNCSPNQRVFAVT